MEEALLISPLKTSIVYKRPKADKEKPTAEVLVAWPKLLAVEIKVWADFINIILCLSTVFSPIKNVTYFIITITLNG